MQRNAIRALFVTAALAAMSLPVFSATSGSGSGLISIARADSNPGGVITGTIPTGIDTYNSPITLTVGNSTILERQATVQPTGPVTLTGGSFSLSIDDPRNNNEGFVVGARANDQTAVIGNGTLTIPGSDFTLTSVNATETSCFGPGPRGCEMIMPNTAAVGSNLGTLQTVAYACPVASIAHGMYDVGLGFNVVLPLATAEDFNAFNASYNGSFTVSVDERRASVARFCGAEVVG